MMTVKIQRMGGYYETPPELLEVTHRIPIERINSFSEQIENGRFAFAASDMQLEMINHDDFLTSASNYLENGFFTYIYWDSVEIFRGVTYYDDVNFTDAPMKSVEWTAFSWLKRLREDQINITREDPGYGLWSIHKWRAPMELDAMFSELEQILQNVPGTPHLGPSYYDIAGVVDVDFDVLLGEEQSSEFQYDDLRRSPIKGTMQAVRYNSETGKIEICEIRGNTIKNFREWKIAGSGETVVDVLEVKILRSNYSDTSFPAIYAEYIMVSGTVPRNVKRIWTSPGVWVEISDNPDHYHKKSSGFSDAESALLNLGKVVRSDTYHLYTFYRSSPGYAIIEKRTLSGVLIGTTSVIHHQPPDLTGFDCVSKDIIAWYDTLDAGGRFYWLRWDMHGHFTGDIQSGELISDALPNLEGYSSIRKLYPTGHTSEEFNGRYGYYTKYYDSEQEFGDRFLETTGYSIDTLPDMVRNSIAIPGNYNVWWTNDPIIIILSAMVYEEGTTPEDILIDIAQFFNGQMFVREGMVHIINRGKYRGEVTVSTDYIQNSGYGRSLKDDRKTEPVLNIKATGCSDNSDNPYDTNTLLGSLRTFYKNQVRWITRTLSVPLAVGKDIELGYKLTVRETGEYGVIIERTLGFDRAGQMAELTFERSTT